MDGVEVEDFPEPAFVDGEAPAGGPCAVHPTAAEAHEDQEARSDTGDADNPAAAHAGATEPARPAGSTGPTGVRPGRPDVHAVTHSVTRTGR